MTLSELIDPLPRAALTGPAEAELTGLKDDSRAVGPGDLFVAVRGQGVDGHDYLSKAIEAGATAVVAEKPMPSGLRGGVSWVLVPDSREALAILSKVWNGDPTADLRIAGVTGTNGKTTTAFLLHHIMKRTLHRAGLIGTIMTDDGERHDPAALTTPGTLELQSILGRMRDNGCQGVAMEVSSIGLEQGRTDAVAFDAAIFTNLTQDHLDYHGTMESYFASKCLLFEQIATRPAGKSPTAVVNRDDQYGEVLVRAFEDRLKILTYGFGVNCDFKAGTVKQSGQGTEFQLHAKGRSYLVRTPLIGRFNVYNSLAALAAASALRIPLRESVAALAEAPQVPGRLEFVGSASGLTVFVDYAHTPDALDNVCRTLRELNPTRLVTVFGCGGDRDREKRPLMAAAASKHSDYCIVTSDNPRSEDPERIVAEIERGMAGRYESIVDRGDAIREAVLSGRSGDVVLVAGKGHEDYQQLADRRISFDDRREARAALNERRKEAAREE